MTPQLCAANKQAASMMENPVTHPLALSAALMLVVKQTEHRGITASICLEHALQDKGP